MRCTAMALTMGMCICPAWAGATEPVSKIRDIYTKLEQNTLTNENNPAHSSNPGLASQFFTPTFLKLWKRDQTCWETGEGVAQMWFSGQDWTIRDVDVRVAESGEDTQSVVAEFKNFDDPQVWTYKFRRHGDEWLVEDVLESGESLAARMKYGCLAADGSIRTAEAAAEETTGIPEPLSPFRDCAECPEMVALPPGRFVMGASPEDGRYAGESMLASERPQHEVAIGYGFAISKYEITVAEFAAYANETGVSTGGECEILSPATGPYAHKVIGTVKPTFEMKYGLITVTDADFRRPGANVTDKHPATCISRREAVGYLEWLSKKTGRHYRLPTEAEWEYAVRAGSTTPYHYGGGPEQLCKYANFADRNSPYSVSAMAPCAESPSPIGTAAVGSYVPNAWGLYDMIGNAFEFVEDCSFDNYDGAPTDGSPWRKAGCEAFVQRSYDFSQMAAFKRSAARCLPGSWDWRGNNLALRAAVSLDDSAWDRKP